SFRPGKVDRAKSLGELRLTAERAPRQLVHGIALDLPAAHVPRDRRVDQSAVAVCNLLELECEQRGGERRVPEDGGVRRGRRIAPVLADAPGEAAEAGRFAGEDEGAQR